VKPVTGSGSLINPARIHAAVSRRAPWRWRQLEGELLTAAPMADSTNPAMIITRAGGHGEPRSIAQRHSAFSRIYFVNEVDGFEEGEESGD
jgi:hypothetical protein